MAASRQFHVQRRLGRAAATIVATAFVMVVCGCSESGPMQSSTDAAATAPAAAAQQRIYIDPETGEIRRPTSAELAAAANEAERKTGEGAAKRVAEAPEGRVEQIKGGGAVLHLDPEDWPEERIDLSSRTGS